MTVPSDKASAHFCVKLQLECTNHSRLDGHKAGQLLILLLTPPAGIIFHPGVNGQSVTFHYVCFQLERATCAHPLDVCLNVLTLI